MKPVFLPLALLTLALGSAPATAGPAFAQAQQRGKLLAGVDYVPPEYKAGTKFRTPEPIETALTEDLGKRLHLAALAVPAANDRGALLAARQADLVLARIADNASIPPSAGVVPTGFASGPMAIMRSDTTIKRWEQLKGRTVCIAEGGRYAGLAARYGALEKRFPAPADALLALRTGRCDAALHDDTLLEELIKLPEWKMFSARLPVGPRTQLVFMVPAADTASAAFLREVAEQWRRSGYLGQSIRKQARNIAFEVYLDQDVPDCH